MKSCRLVIFGSRDAFPSEDQIEAALPAIDLDDTEVVCGLARGADSCGAVWAKRMQIPVTEFRPDWDRYGKRAGFVRNKQMAEYATCGIGFWKGESNGTANMTSWLVALGKPVRLVTL